MSIIAIPIPNKVYFIFTLVIASALDLLFSKAVIDMHDISSIHKIIGVIFVQFFTLLWILGLIRAYNTRFTEFGIEQLNSSLKKIKIDYSNLSKDVKWIDGALIFSDHKGKKYKQSYYFYTSNKDSLGDLVEYIAEKGFNIFRNGRLLNHPNN